MNTVKITNNAKQDLTSAIKFKEDKVKARDTVKGVLSLWSEGVKDNPEMSKKLELLPTSPYRESIRDGYRLIYRYDKKQKFIYLVCFCSVRMDLETLLRNRSLMGLLR